jgi:hypothetical protein
MSRQGGGFGVVVLLVVLAVVLLLVARSWQSVAPTAIEVSTPAGGTAVPDHGEAQAAGEVRSGALPRLDDMRRETGTHAAQVQDALRQSQ